MKHADTVDTLGLFGKEVLPRLREYRSAVQALDQGDAAA